MKEAAHKKKTFPDYHPLHIFNEFVYLDSSTRTHTVYIFRFDKKGAIVVINQKDDYFKGTIKPIIFTDDYNWEENNKSYSCAVDSMDKVVDRLCQISGIKGDEE